MIFLHLSLHKHQFIIIKNTHVFLNFRNSNTIGHVARMPVARAAGQYNMSHRRRGLALIFNNEIFSQEGLKKRTGTNVDADNLKATLENLLFEVKVFTDYTFDEIDETTTNGSQ